jgi:hypothetical protein
MDKSKICFLSPSCGNGYFYFHPDLQEKAQLFHETTTENAPAINNSSSNSSSGSSIFFLIS